MNDSILASCRALLVIAFTFGLLADEKLPAKAETQAPAVAETKAAPPLSKTIRLEFKMESAESSQAFSILCAESEYRFHYDYSKSEGEQNIDVSGTLKEVGASGRLLLSFKTSMTQNRSDGVSGTLSTAGSALVEIGKSKKLMNMAGYSI